MVSLFRGHLYSHMRWRYDQINENNENSLKLSAQIGASFPYNKTSITFCELSFCVPKHVFPWTIYLQQKKRKIICAGVYFALFFFPFLHHSLKKKKLGHSNSSQSDEIGANCSCEGFAICVCLPGFPFRLSQCYQNLCPFVFSFPLHLIFSLFHLSLSLFFSCPCSLLFFLVSWSSHYHGQGFVIF